MARFRVLSAETTMLLYIRTRFVAAASVLLAAASCGEGTDTQPGYAHSPRGPTNWCKSNCSYTGRCMYSVAGACLTDCLNDNRAYFAKVNEAYLEKMAPCIDNAACTDWDTMTDACYQSTSPTLMPSATLIEFCSAMSAKFFECFYSDDDLSFCSQDFAAWADAGLVRAKACVSSPCAGINDCLSNAFSGDN